MKQKKNYPIMIKYWIIIKFATSYLSENLHIVFTNKIVNLGFFEMCWVLNPDDKINKEKEMTTVK